MKEQLESLVAQMVESGVPFPAALGEFEREYIGQVLRKTRGNRSRASRLLGIHRNTVSRKIAAYQQEVRHRDSQRSRRVERRSAA